MRQIEDIDNLDNESNLDEGNQIERMRLIRDLEMLENKHISMLNQKTIYKWLEQVIPTLGTSIPG